MSLDPKTLIGLITKVVPDSSGAAKIVHVDWLKDVAEANAEEGSHEHRVRLLQDQVSVAGQATDEEILMALERRKLDIAPTLTYDVPNPEANQGLIGREV